MTRQRLFPLLGLLGVGACSSLLGIEDLHEGPREGAAGDEGSGATAMHGGGDDSGTSGSLGNAGDASVAGSGGTSGSGPNSVAGGPSNEAGAGGETSTPVSGAVHGHVIDFWGHGLSGIPVQVGDTLVSTDAKGDFTVPDAPGKYDASLAYNHEDTAQVDAYVYRGLTRRDPTLQIFRGSERLGGTIDIAFTGLPATQPNNQRVSVSVTSGDGATEFDDASWNGYSQAGVYWDGPLKTAATAFGLLWQYDGTELPLSFVAFKSAPVALTDGANSKVTLNLTKTAITAGTLQGTVKAATGKDRSNQVFVRVGGTGSIALLDDDKGPDSFSYNVPSLDAAVDATFTVAAVEGYAYDRIAIAHVDGLKAGSKPMLQIPSVVNPGTPLSGATNVTTGVTKFTFPSDTNAGPYVLEFDSQADDKGYKTLFVITSDKQTVIPTVLGEDFMYPAGEYIWRVETYGKYASVDAMADALGFADQFGSDEATPRGPRKGAGEYTASAIARFTMK